MFRGVPRTVMLGGVASAALICAAIMVFGADRGAVMEHVLFSVILIALTWCSALLVFILRHIFRGVR